MVIKFRFPFSCQLLPILERQVYLLLLTWLLLIEKWRGYFILPTVASWRIAPWLETGGLFVVLAKWVSLSAVGGGGVSFALRWLAVVVWSVSFLFRETAPFQSCSPRSFNLCTHTEYLPSSLLPFVLLPPFLVYVRFRWSNLKVSNILKIGVCMWLENCYHI